MIGFCYYRFMSCNILTILTQNITNRGKLILRAGKAVRNMPVNSLHCVLKQIIFLIALIPFLLFAEDNFKPLFNGKTLEGWRNINCAQNTETGGWRYRTYAEDPREKGDLSASGWQLMALRARDWAGWMCPTHLL